MQRKKRLIYWKKSILAVLGRNGSWNAARKSAFNMIVRSEKLRRVVARLPCIGGNLSKSKLEEAFMLQCKAYQLYPTKEHKFHDKRKWKFDFAFLREMVAIECEGGVWTNGRHTRGSGFIADIEKYNVAAAMGWKVFRFDGGMIKSGHAIKFVVDYFRENPIIDFERLRLSL